MMTFSTITTTTPEVTPAWIAGERYLYCDNFIDRISKKTSLFSSIKGFFVK